MYYNSDIFFGCAFLFIVLAGGIVYLNNQGKEKMTDSQKNIVVEKKDELQTLYTLKKFVESLDFEHYSKQSILKTIDNEIYYTERKIFMQLGKETYFNQPRDYK